jgi:hypothetical protein
MLRLATILMVVAAMGACRAAHTDLPPPPRDPTDALGIMDNYLFGGDAAFFHVDKITAWNTRSFHVALFAEEPHRSRLVALLDRFAGLSGRSYVLSNTNVDVVFIAQDDLANFDLASALLDQTDVARKFTGRLALKRDKLDTYYAESVKEGGGFAFSAMFDEKIGGVRRVIVVIVDTSRNPAAVAARLDYAVTTAFVPNANVGLMDNPFYWFFAPRAPEQSVAAIKAYYAADLRAGMTRPEVLDRLRRALEADS